MPNISLTLNRRKDGRWQKKIDGEVFFFGNRQTTENEARLRLIDFLQRRAMATTQRQATDTIELRLVADQFAAACERRVADDDMLPATWKAYDKAMRSFVQLAGRNTLVSNLTPDDFKRIRNRWQKEYGCYALDRYIQSVRTMFNWAKGKKIIRTLPDFEDQFSKTSKSDKATERLMNRPVKGDRPFSVDQINALLDHPLCVGDLRTFILLGLNGGFYSVDISDLAWGDIIREDGVWLIHNQRNKTRAPRRCPLWPEVVDALALGQRHAKTDRVFMTAHGNPWNQRNGTDSIRLLFDRLQVLAGIKGKRSFGALRHTHVTNVNDHADKDAARLVRAHQIEGIEAHYDFPSVQRLKAITDLARRRFLLNSVRVLAATTPEESAASDHGSSPRQSLYGWRGGKPRPTLAGSQRAGESNRCPSTPPQSHQGRLSS